jgi:hypothetical protein
MTLMSYGGNKLQFKHNQWTFIFLNQKVTIIKEKTQIRDELHAEKDQQFLSQKVALNKNGALYTADPGGKIQFLGYRISPCIQTIMSL